MGDGTCSPRVAPNGSERTRVLIADDHPVVLAGLSSLLRSLPGFHLLATCGDGAEALRLITELRPEIAILDMAMPGMTGLEIVKAMQARGLDTKVVILTASASDQQITGSVNNGVRGIILKDTAADELHECLKAVQAGNTWLKPAVIEPAVRREAVRFYETEKYAGALTPRERDIAVLVARGLSNKEISRMAGISDGTVRIHLHNIYSKLGLPNRTALATVAQKYIAESNPDQ